MVGSKEMLVFAGDADPSKTELCKKRGFLMAPSSPETLKALKP